MNHAPMSRTHRPFITVALTLVVFVLVSVAAQAGPGKGPKASIDVVTVCALDGSTFSVEAIVHNKTSKTDAVVNAWTIDGVYLDRAFRGNTSFTFDPPLQAGESGIATTVGGGLILSGSFSLCDPAGGIRSELVNARGLNADTSVSFGPNGGTIMNRCGDDPTTEDVIEPNGIKLSLADLATIDAACQAP